MRAFAAVGRRSRRRPAPPSLAALLSSFGAAGLVAAGTRPGLLAAVDQHAAAVRDGIGGAPADPAAGPPTPTLLAAYADGVRTAAAEHGWRPPAGPVNWSDPDWVLLRLLAVCALARDAGVRT
ncbi:DUF6401 family natural product biosynthesis protein [Plantactinospora sp. KBS50]|uniref:DUF6401 family natural product biosynthesis protein n=1 Tax=Plantactinospora sp. KBS50 TaxID=2024580 RepID=UPI000BAAF798|nr:DUF6401 family natural product biosynthesis protein [Plantactinospora sp. KBS50]ASW54567.1 hypothetical protein CIK06_10775 [Plantactinospora sp. KBS50]